VKVLVVGEQVPGQLAWLCARAFRRLGAEVAAVNTSGHPWQRYRASRWPPLSVAANALQKSWANRQVRALAEAFRPGLIFVTKGEELKAETLLRARQRTGAALANWNPDSPLNRLNTTGDLLQALPVFDRYYTWGRFLLPELERLGAQRPAYLPFAFDPELHQPRGLPAEERRALGSDVVFVGTWEPERAAALAHLDGLDLGIWGNHWDRLAPGDSLRRRWRGEAHGERLSRVYSASGVALNFIRAQNGPAHNMRTFEAPACGILMLASRTEEQVELLGEDEGAVFFDSMETMRERAAYYVAHPQQRGRIARCGRQRLSQGHTYADRMAQVLAHAEQDRRP
jgi:hypothetical protein